MRRQRVAERDDDPEAREHGTHGVPRVGDGHRDLGVLRELAGHEVATHLERAGRTAVLLVALAEGDVGVHAEDAALGEEPTDDVHEVGAAHLASREGWLLGNERRM